MNDPIRNGKRSIRLLTSLLMLIVTVLLIASNKSIVSAKTDIKINKTNSTVYVGGNKLKLSVSGTTDKISWKSSDPKIAKVTSYGNVYGLKKGNVTITATVNKVKLTCKVNVKSSYITPKTVELDVNNNITLGLKGFSKNSAIIWSSNDKSIATVNKNGILEAHAEGTVTISAKVNNKKFTRKVIVNWPIEKTVEYLADRTVQYDSLTDRHILLFSLKDKDQQRLMCDATVQVNIKDDSDVLIFSDTYEVSSNDFGYWTSPLLGERLLCSIYIPSSKIDPANSKSGTISFIVYNDNGFRFDESKLEIDNIPYASPAATSTLKLPQTPILVSYYGFSNSLNSIVTIKNITYKFEDSYDGSIKLTVSFEGEKTYDYEGINNSSHSEIGLKLYKDGYVIDSTTHYTNRLAVGEKFRNSEEVFYDLEPGDYELILLDVN